MYGQHANRDKRSCKLEPVDISSRLHRNLRDLTDTQLHHYFIGSMIAPRDIYRCLSRNTESVKKSPSNVALRKCANLVDASGSGSITWSKKITLRFSHQLHHPVFAHPSAHHSRAIGRVERVPKDKWHLWGECFRDSRYLSKSAPHLTRIVTTYSHVSAHLGLCARYAVSTIPYYQESSRTDQCYAHHITYH